jgi:16S rRNA (guanine1516-N2)-methyltransferase
LDICIFAEDQLFLAKAKKLAKELDIAIVTSLNQTDFSNIILVNEHGISIKYSGAKVPIYVDFNSRTLSHRNKARQKELIIKALGIGKLNSPTIIDTTAGMAKDSFIIASYGYNVQMIERSPVIAALLGDGLERGLHNLEISSIIKNMHLINGDAINLLPSMRADIIYLDPMFPDKANSSAAAKKEMQLFREIIGDDVDASKLFEVAFASANYRVVVKRPIKSAYISDIKPSFKIEGSSSRFDIYQKVL